MNHSVINDTNKLNVKFNNGLCGFINYSNYVCLIVIELFCPLVFECQC